MNRSFRPVRAWLPMVFVLLAGMNTRMNRTAAADTTGTRVASAQEIANLIDRRLHIHDSAPVTFADDATFLRRLTLDLAGRIPTVAEVRQYLDNKPENKALVAIERLFNSGAHYQTMAKYWRRVWVPQADTAEYSDVANDFEVWLAREMQRGIGYDELVRKVIEYDEAATTTDPINPSGFYIANESMPGSLAASATRAFLGVNLDCAQCHDHPFARWTREEFWQTAAFFAPPRRSADGLQQPVVRPPDSELEFSPKLLSKVDVKWPESVDSVSVKHIFADWMVHEGDGFLARNAVNRLWSLYFGDGLVEPMDDLTAEMSQLGPRAQLMNELAHVFVESGYNTELMCRAMVQSDAYRLSSCARDPVIDPVGVFVETGPPEVLTISSARVRGLTAEQLFNSLRTAAGLPAVDRSRPSGGRDNTHADFISTFHVERPSHAERSISQALTMMNGPVTSTLADAQSNRTLSAILKSPFMSFDEQIDTVFLAVLSRPPNDEERDAAQRYAQSFDANGHEQCLVDLFWSLINSPEFNTNH